MTPAAIVHCDWSKDPSKQWMAVGTRKGDRWTLGTAVPVEAPSTLVARATSFALESGPVLLGFDFPIGVPKAYGAQTPHEGFLSLLDRWRRDGQWDLVATSAERLSVERPFYQPRPSKGSTKAHLVAGLNLAARNALLRLCEMPQTTGRRAASELFWLVGAKQVGLGAIDGWRDVIAPSLANGAALWPHHGTLGELLDRAPVVVAETYPAEVYDWIAKATGAEANLGFGRGRSKRTQSDRRVAGGYILELLARRGINASGALVAQLKEGFGPRKSGEDPFDAVVGAVGMLEVVTDSRAEGAPYDQADIRVWEGWILGQRWREARAVS